MADESRPPWPPLFHQRGLLLGLTWLAFAVRVLGLLGQSLWRDEVDALRFATGPLPELLAMFRNPGQNGPLFFLAMRPWLAAAGHSEFALRLPAALAGALAVPIGYTLMARLTASRSAAAIAAALLAVAPYLVWYGQEAKMYAALTVLVPASLLLTLAAAQRGGWPRWLALYGVTSLGFYTHLLAVLVVPVQALWLLLAPSGPQAGKRRLAGLGYLAALILPYLPLARWQVRMWLAPGGESGYALAPLGDILAVMWSAFSYGVTPVRSLLLLFPFTVALIAALALWPRWGEGRRSAPLTDQAGAEPVEAHPHPTEPVAAHPNAAEHPERRAIARSRRMRSGLFTNSHPSTGRYPSSILADRPAQHAHILGAGIPTPSYVLALLLTWLLLPPLGIYAISLIHPIFTERYLIWAMPAYLGLIALGCVAFGRIWRLAGAALVIALLAVAGMGFVAQVSRPIKADFRAAAAYVLAAREPADLLVFQIPYNRYTFSYYANGQRDPDTLALPWAEGPYTNNGMTEAEASAWLVERIGDAPAAWLIASEAPLWDARGLTESWFAVHGAETARAEFARVAVTRYSLRAP